MFFWGSLIIGVLVTLSGVVAVRMEMKEPIVDSEDGKEIHTFNIIYIGLLIIGISFIFFT